MLLWGLFLGAFLNTPRVNTVTQKAPVLSLFNSVALEAFSCLADFLRHSLQNTLKFELGRVRGCPRARRGYPEAGSQKVPTNQYSILVPLEGVD